jgi:hypothetical protein
MSYMMKGIIILLMITGFAWANPSNTAQTMQSLSDDELEVVSDHGLATGSKKEEHDSHDHQHGQQNDTLSTKQQENVIYSTPMPRILPLK